MSSLTNGHDLALGLPPKGPDYNRADEVAALLDSVKSLVHSFVAAADSDAEALGSGHGLQIPGGAPRTVLLEKHDPHKLASLLDLSISPSHDSPAGAREDFVRAAQDVQKYSVNTSSPAFMDKLYSSPSPPGLAADLLLSSLNTNSHVYACSPALTLVEKFVGRELAALCGIGRATGSSSPASNAGGVTVPGGSAANTTAMLVARNVRFPQIKEEGLAALLRPLAVFASAAAHYSAVTAAQTLGLGKRSVRKVSTLENDAIDPAALEVEIQRAKDQGEIPFFVLGTAGTTVRGAYDDLKALGELSRQHGAWFHVDACWGGGVMFSDALRYKLAGVELADSVAFNPHKMLGVPLTCSFLMGADLRMFWAANRLDAGYLFHGDSEQANVEGVEVDNGDKARQQVGDDLNLDWRSSPWVKSAPRADTVFDLAQFVPQCGRRPEALKFYLHWRYYGTQGIARHVEASFAGARRVMQLVGQSPALKPVGSSVEPCCAQACFYYCGADGRIAMDKRVTRAIVTKLAGRGWMTDFAPGRGKDEEYIRAVCNRLTSEAVAQGLIKAVTAAGQEVETELGL